MFPPAIVSIVWCISVCRKKHIADGLPTCPLDMDDPSHGFSRLPWCDRLCIDDSGAAAVATDLWTGASAPLGDGKYVAEFLDEDAIIMEVDTEQEIEPGIKLGTDIIKGCGDELFIVSVDKDGLVAIKESYDDKMASHEIGRAELQTGHCRSKCILQTAIFRQARPARCRVFWSMNDVYQALQLSTYKGVPSKWIFNQKSTWKSLFKDMYLASM